MTKEKKTNDQFLLSRVEDTISLSNRKSQVRFLGWLDGREKILVENYLKKQTDQFAFYGGYPDAERVYLSIWSEKMEKPAEEIYPFGALTVFFRKQDELTHRDFLGSLLSLQIERSAMGDFLVGEGMAVLFLDKVPLKMVHDSLEKVGRIGVRSVYGQPDILPPAFLIEEKRIVIASLRLDVVVAGVINISRMESTCLIQNGLVKVNYQENRENSYLLQEGTLLSIRGYGRFRMKQVLGETRKGRISVLLEKYK